MTPPSLSPKQQRLISRRVVLLLLGLSTAQLTHRYMREPLNRRRFVQTWTPIVQNLRQRLAAILVDRRRDDALQALDDPLQDLRHLPTPPPPAPISPTPPTPPNPPAPASPPAFPTLTLPEIPYLNPTPGGNLVRYTTTQLLGVPFHLITVDLKAPETLLTIGLANNAPFANSSRGVYGDEPFTSMVDRAYAAAVINGTFFGKDENKRILGNLVAGGRVLKYSPWENYGTTLGIKANRQLEMVTARSDGKPRWRDHWFSLTCGPRLVHDGEVELAPKSEGFRDPHVLATAYRCAIGYPKSGDQLLIVAFAAPLSLEETAKVMQAIGCQQAMNLDGGSSQGLAYRGDIIIQPGRNLTNAIVVYDAQRPAPRHLMQAQQAFELGARPDFSVFQ